ncbi:hypothetical protein AB7185_07105 [Providencia rettgeri]
MATPQKRSIIEIYDLFSYIETNTAIEPFKMKRAIEDAQKLEDHYQSLMVTGLAYAAGKDYKSATDFLKKASECGREGIYLNYVTYLEKTFQYDEYVSALKELAIKYNHFNINWGAKNLCLCLGDLEQAEFHLARVIEMINNEQDRNKLVADFHSDKQKVENFMAKSILSENEIKIAAKIASDVAKEHNVLFGAHEFDVGGDDECPAFIFSAYSLDGPTLADMDIELVTRLATNEQLAGKDFTAWYRGIEDKEENRL